MICDKITYEFRSHAKQAADASSARLGHSAKVYKCPDCGKYHLASTGKKKKNNKARNKKEKYPFKYEQHSATKENKKSPRRRD